MKIIRTIKIEDDFARKLYDEGSQDVKDWLLSQIPEKELRIYKPRPSIKIKEEAFNYATNLPHIEGGENKPLSNREQERLFLRYCVEIINTDYSKQIEYEQNGVGYAIKYSMPNDELYVEFITGYSDLCFPREEHANLCKQVYGDIILEYFKKY